MGIIRKSVALAAAASLLASIAPVLAQDSQLIIGGASQGATGRSITRTFDSAVRRSDQARAFFDARAENEYDGVEAQAIARPDATILQGTIVPGVLETAIQSDLPSLIRAVTSRDVYSLDGRRVLLPAGSRLIGEYSSAIARGQTRVFIIWTRAITPDGISVALDSFGTDPVGRAGMGGRVDRKLLQRYGSAAVLTLIDGAAQFLAGIAQDSVAPNATRVELEARVNAAEGVGENVQSLAEAALEENIDIPPTIHVAQGSRVHIIVTRDLSFAEFYQDPVEEEIDRILRGEH